MTVTHFNPDTLIEESKTYTTDFIRYHLHYSDSSCPDRQYLDDMERKVGDAISRQVELWKQTDSCYQKAIISDDTEKILGLENCFFYMAREAVFECMVYIRGSDGCAFGCSRYFSNQIGIMYQIP